MGHEKKKKKDRDRDRDRDRERRRHRSRSGSASPEHGDSERRHRRKHKKHKSDRKRRHEVDDSPPFAAPPPPKLSRSSASPPLAPPPPQLRGEGAPAAPPPPRLRSSPPAGGGEGGGGGESSLSIEETNRLRAELGLRPLDVKPVKGTGDGGEGSAEGPRMGSSDTYAIHKKPEHIGDKKKTEKLREKLASRREARAIEARMTRVRGLGDSDDDDESASAWVTKSRQLQKEKEMASKRAALLDDLDAEFGVGDLVAADTSESRAAAYSAGDLRGLTVEHQADQFVEGRDVVLTIKDKAVLDEDESDVLVNVNMVDDERHEKNVAIRRQKPGYRPDDQDEWDEQGNYRPKSLLSQYDEQLDGEKKSSFVIGAAGQASAAVNQAAVVKEKLKQKMKQQAMQSLDMPAPKIASEFYTEAEMASFKKVKKKVRKVRKKGILKADDLLPLADDDPSAHLGSRVKREPADSDGEAAVTDDTAPVTDDLSGVKLEDEEADTELSRAIERSRRLKQDAQAQESESSGATRSTERRLAELAAKLREKEAADASVTQSIVLNSTAEFCRSLGDIPTYGMSGNRDEEAEEIASLERELAEERRRSDLARAADGGVWEEVGPDETAAPTEREAAERSAILEAEPEVGAGLAGALKLAMKKGYVDQEESGKKGASQQVLAHLRAQNYSIEDKSAMDDDRRGRGGGGYGGGGGGPVTEFKDKANYKPEVKLEYIDDQGRLLSSKEAFRYLSHKFHGKGSGKMKTEKREKKIQESLLMAQMNSTDTPLNTLSRLQEKQKELQSPYVVLSGAKLLGSGSSGSQVAKH
ncbi:U4/U6.U5 tri-snRNP-associated protein 1 [Amphibalanus amphitrite]|uniref:U4/U6.U5 tri-snRNP-associated protein 1 n=1 Tax=Amphibalanus amphitrite TaxID=1232801 RepID=A0A6A4VA37_AMPAM|nr:U4/U6.U5 tri-snRNP-associated protein 1 [Amphibalanus amphitrite]